MGTFQSHLNGFLESIKLCLTHFMFKDDISSTNAPKITSKLQMTFEKHVLLLYSSLVIDILSWSTTFTTSTDETEDPRIRFFTSEKIQFLESQVYEFAWNENENLFAIVTLENDSRDHSLVNPQLPQEIQNLKNDANFSIPLGTLTNLSLFSSSFEVYNLNYRQVAILVLMSFLKKNLVKLLEIKESKKEKKVKFHISQCK